MLLSDHRLYQLLLENHYLASEDLERAKVVAQNRGLSLQEAVLSLDLLSDQNLGVILADYLRLPFVNLNRIVIPEDLTVILPEPAARKHRTVIFGRGVDGLNAATADPTNQQFFEFLAKKARQPINVYYATEQDIEGAMGVYKKKIQTAFDELLQSELSAAQRSGAGEAPIIKMVDTLIEYAYDNQASDIHIEPTGGDSLVRFRIDGLLHDVLRLPRSLHEAVVTRIKVLSRLRTDEHLSAQDGRMSAQLPREEIDIRVSLVPILDGEKAVLRLLTSGFRQFGLNDLGLSGADLEKIKRAIAKPFGMVLSSGPTGCGKTTTMYALIKALNTRERNIATIEDPVEYEIEGVNQIQANPKTNLTFAEGLRSILRQDPDIIYVGEVRDEETADIAINSALTGHLVLSTMHTNDAPTALPRLIDMAIEPFLIASTVNAIIAQRLVRRICDRCKVSYTLDADSLYRLVGREAAQRRFGTAADVRLYRGKGCQVCHNTGFVGRTGVFEVLPVTSQIQELINQKADSETLRREAVAEGMRTMIEDGLEKAERGITTVEEIMKATKE